MEMENKKNAPLGRCGACWLGTAAVHSPGMIWLLKKTKTIASAKIPMKASTNLSIIQPACSILFGLTTIAMGVLLL
jgi:hypothetical protein